MHKYLSLIKISFTAQKNFIPVLCARVFFLLLLVCIFNQFWHIVKQENAVSALINPVDFIWYLLIGCVLQYGRAEGFHYRIEQEVKSGNIAYGLLRPVSVIGAYFCEAMGTFLFRLPFLFCVGAVFLLILTNGELPTDFSALPVIFSLMVLSAIFISLCTVFIGLSTLWMQDALPMFWLIQKAEYILGGLFFPLSFYPEWLQQIAFATPFGWINYGVARLIYNYSSVNAVETFIHILFWIIIMICVNTLFYRLLVRRIAIHGG